MNLKNILQIGEKVEVYYKGNEIKPENKKSYSMVQDIIEQNEIIITMPILRGIQVFLEPGQEVEINFFRDEGQFTFKARIIERSKRENVDLLKLIGISPIKRIQRRNYYRLKITLPIYIKVLTNDANENLDSEKWLNAYTLNLSGGGAKISLDSSLEKGTLLQCKLKIKNQDIILNGKVVRCQLVQKDTLPMYELGLSFVDITEYQRDLIIGFIFEKQRKLRKKGFI